MYLSSKCFSLTGSWRFTKNVFINILHIMCPYYDIVLLPFHSQTHLTSVWWGIMYLQILLSFLCEKKQNRGEIYVLGFKGASETSWYVCAAPGFGPALHMSHQTKVLCDDECCNDPHSLANQLKCTMGRRTLESSKFTWNLKKNKWLF